MNFRLNPLAHAVNAALAVTLVACGGGGDAAPADTAAASAAPAPAPGAAPAPAPAPAAPVMATLSGTVMVDQAILNAVVCLDLNANNACDPGEPTSARTGADGVYNVTYDSAAVSAAQVAEASLITTMVPGLTTATETTIDAADTSVGNTSKAYVLKQVPGKAGPINPLTTLVAAGVAGGMTEATARTNAAVQLGIGEGKIDNYQDEPAHNKLLVQDNARTMAKVTASALEAGLPLEVGDQFAAVNPAAGDLASLTVRTNTNYSYRTFDIAAKPQGTPGSILKDTRRGSALGAPLSATALYNLAYLTSAGWVRCDEASPFTATRGRPNRSLFCGASASAGYTAPSSLAGQAMADVVTAMQADPLTNTINNGVDIASLTGLLGAVTFPSGSSIGARTGLTLSQPVFINSISGDARPAAETTLEQTIASRSAAGVTLPGVGTSLSLGLGSGDFRNLRVAFTGTTSPTEGTVQFYECALDATLAVASACGATTTGTYSISTVNGARVLRFAGHAETVMNHIRMLAEVKDAPTVAAGSRVFTARENKTTVAANTSTSKRLNPTAWAAMKARLGLFDL